METKNSAKLTYLKSSKAEESNANVSARLPKMSGKCPRCSKTAYDAESQKVLGKFFHNSCFKCRQCGKGLQLTDYTPEKEEIYCKACHASLFGPKGFRGGAGGGAVMGTGLSGSAATSGASLSGGGAFCSSCGTKSTGGKFCSGCGGAL